MGVVMNKFLSAREEMALSPEERLNYYRKLRKALHGIPEESLKNVNLYKTLLSSVAKLKRTFKLNFKEIRRNGEYSK